MTSDKEKEGKALLHDQYKREMEMSDYKAQDETEEHFLDAFEAGNETVIEVSGDSPKQAQEAD
jgi:hypothetical protein